ncbi:hypothetical protein F5879DRAFT_708151 [Lentinula edodes]|nr:hypothetical protein F5879DRAFT_708151 [Lentinula edodes]
MVSCLLVKFCSWVHVDNCYAPWAFSFTAGRKKFSTQSASDGITPPEYGGANFVDITLRVVVVNAPGTLFSFQPQYPHGTTVTGGTTNFNIVFTFSRKIGEAVAELDGREHFGSCRWGAGEGNLDNISSGSS